METNQPKSACRAFTVLESMVVIVALAMLCLLLVPASTGYRNTANRIQCNNNLKQVGMSFRIWSGDHKGCNPMQVSTNDGGSMEFAGTTNMFRHLQVLSNELNTPFVLICPGDKERRPATNFTDDFSNSHTGYFIGLDANETNPAMFLAGDRNLANGVPLTSGMMFLTTNPPAGWTKAMHGEIGNVGLADGSVQQLSSASLREAVAVAGVATNRLAFP